MHYWYVITISVILYLDTRSYMQLTKSWLHTYTPFSGQNAAKDQIFTFMRVFACIKQVQRDYFIEHKEACTFCHT